MKILPLAALCGAASLATIALTDALWRANMPDTPSAWSLEDGPEFMLRGLALAHGIAYALFAAVLIRGGRTIDGGRRFPRIVRWVIVSGFAVFGILYTGLGFLDVRYAPTGIFEIATTAAFIATLLVPVLLGVALLRRREFRVPVVFLLSPVAVLPLTLVLATVSTWAHPAYLETVVNSGVALLGIAAIGVESTPAVSGDAPSSMNRESRLQGAG
ncbi:hypothetical protein [Mycetocola zhadangensis]|uniref:DUF998 domain-containing protein n=1 Tax=Mycetocola zhadangensis TaxID=1164595 RepID=A0A3L7J557_9MICO|nr:hypothetical protein [Mycetocola zhadangensis]RLQ85465.1 hypothetical protein D9V28_00800 [Mycetocola zhadangensis]GGE82845.1 hypothetical protein GCM10011313_01580 [Mycetocola zhadangensis]